MGSMVDDPAQFHRYLRRSLHRAMEEKPRYPLHPQHTRLGSGHVNWHPIAIPGKHDDITR